MNKKDVCAIEVIYKADTKRNRRMFKLSSNVYRYDALELQSKLESYDHVFRVLCHTTLNHYI